MMQGGHSNDRPFGLRPIAAADWRASIIMQATSLLLGCWVVALCDQSTQLAESPTHDGAAAASFEGRPVYSVDCSRRCISVKAPARPQLA